MEIIIEKASKSHLGAILSLVKELAIYEKAEHEVSATLEDYEREFDLGTFEVIIARTENQIIGMALYYLTFSTWKGRMIYLEDFIVTKQFRGKGVGQLIFDAFLKEVEMQKAILAKWQVLDWNEPAIKFYEKNKAVIEKEWWNVKMFT